MRKALTAPVAAWVSHTANKAILHAHTDCDSWELHMSSSLCSTIADEHERSNLRDPCTSGQCHTCCPGNPTVSCDLEPAASECN